MCLVYTMLTTAASQPFPAMEMGISDISQVFANCRSVHAHISESPQWPSTSSTAQRRVSPGGPAWLLEGRSSWHRESRLVSSRAQCLNVVVMTPNRCPAVQEPPSKPLSLMLIKFLSSTHGSALAGSHACVLHWNHFSFVRKLKWFCCSEWRTEVVTTICGHVLPSPSSTGHEIIRIIAWFELEGH